MSKLKLPANGSCRCGQIKFKVDAQPLVTMACHCKGCQRMSSSAYSLSAAIPSEGFSVTEGEPVLGGLRADLKHYFCPSCMSWLFTRMDGMDSFVNIRPTMLEEVGWFSPFVETYTSTKLPFAETGAQHSYPEFPPMEAFEPLVKEYQALP
ncbi:GFA family protein [Oryzifoliimicrobium ureilyticus]|uniref:GFA family protein n=1 Tax=Oryzifoliimicrobium ureilyticus TaxID=3113724 RepID=UPI0030760DC3